MDLSERVCVCVRMRLCDMTQGGLRGPVDAVMVRIESALDMTVRWRRL